MNLDEALIILREYKKNNSDADYEKIMKKAQEIDDNKGMWRLYLAAFYSKPFARKVSDLI